MSLDLTKEVDLREPDPREIDPADPRRARRAVARGLGVERTVVIVVGLVLLALGALVALLSYGVFGTARASRPLLDPVVVDVLGAEPLLSRLVALAAAVVLVLVGLGWAARAVRPEPRPDLRLEAEPGTTVVVEAGAAAEAVVAGAAALPGVGRARVRLVGSRERPAARVTLWLTDDADVTTVLRRLDDDVLAHLRTSLGLRSLPTAVRLELEHQVQGPRVQ